MSLWMRLQDYANKDPATWEAREVRALFREAAQEIERNSFFVDQATYDMRRKDRNTDRLHAMLDRIACLSMSQFASASDMACEAVNLARAAINPQE